MQAKYIGDPTQPEEQSRLPNTTEMFGVIFERDKFSDVPDELAAKFKGNSHFETKGKEPPPPPAPPPPPPAV